MRWQGQCRKFVKSQGLKCSINQKGNYFELSILKENNAQGIRADVAPEGITCNSIQDDYVVLVSRDTFGEGLEELGRVLLKNYLYTLTEIENLPKAILFVNGGVKLTTEGASSIETIKELEDMGVEILSCGTCLDYYKLKDKLKVGKVTNMYEIVERTTKMRTINL